VRYPEYYDWNSQVSICNLGAMKGLGNITAIPSSGFTVPMSSNYSVACEAGHGYVVKIEGKLEGTEAGKIKGKSEGYGLTIYVRLYVEEPIVDTFGGIMGAKVKYQYPFNP
jgi:hypothetical protein